MYVECDSTSDESLLPQTLSLVAVYSLRLIPAHKLTLILSSIVVGAHLYLTS